jgi:CTLH/CRA C-terminal to LisH motif domain
MGRIGQAIEQTQRAYPGLLESNQNLMFMLKCRQFVEMVNGSDLDVSLKRRRFSPEFLFILYTQGIQLSDDIAFSADISDSVNEALPTVADGQQH